MDGCWAGLVQLNLSQPTLARNAKRKNTHSFISFLSLDPLNSVPFRSNTWIKSINSNLEASGSATKITSQVHQVRLWTVGKIIWISRAKSCLILLRRKKLKKQNLKYDAWVGYWICCCVCRMITKKGFAPNFLLCWVFCKILMQKCR